MKKINQKGITLIALVVTIIVLIILAGISLNLLLGDNGIIKKAQDAGSKYKESANEEDVKLSNLDSRIQSVLDGNGFQGGSGGNGNGNGNGNNTTPPEETGPLGTPINTNNYGNIVYNYTAQDLIWRLFYEDSNNIYLISETTDGDYPINNINVCDYPNSTYAPKDSSYVSGEDVSSQGKNLLLLAGGATSCSVGTNSSGYNLFTSSYTNSNIWGTAYLCDTTKWTTYKIGSASWAMGGPTIELFAASYNATHTNHQISLGMSSFGYTYNTEDNWFSTTENNGIYYLKNTGSWWIPAPDGTWQNERVSGTYEGRGKINCIRARDDSVSARPVVCISKSTGFTCQFEVARTGALGAPVNVDNYGRHVTNYTAADLKWRLFYEDSNNIYLISETQDGDYPINSIMPCYNNNGTGVPRDSSYVSGESISQQGKDLMLLAGGATSSSVGTILLGTNTNGTNLFVPSTTNPNMWGTAFLCDTTKWLAYKSGQAAWAMGGPTVELFTASYKATHSDSQDLLSIGDYGYYKTTNLDTYTSNDNYGIYAILHTGDWWVASPTNSTSYGIRWLFISGFNGYLASDYVTMGSNSVRPVVCIQKSTGFTCNFASE